MIRLLKVGFEKSKIGANETELGYAIKRTRLIGLMVGGMGCLGLLGLLGIWSQFETLALAAISS